MYPNRMRTDHSSIVRQMSVLGSLPVWSHVFQEWSLSRGSLSSRGSVQSGDPPAVDRHL